VGIDVDDETVENLVASSSARIGAIPAGDGDRTYNLTVEDDVLLADRSTDAARVGPMLSRVVASADRLEQTELPGNDASLASFQPHIQEEVVPDDV
jgi:hypothetical protein